MTKRQRRKQRVQLDAEVPVKTESPQVQVSQMTNMALTENLNSVLHLINF